VLRATCRRTEKADSISASGVFRTVEALRPLTLLVDEADTFLKDNEELRGVLNSGFERSGQVIRVVEVQGEHRPVRFATFAPLALAAIGDLPSTLADRAVPIRMERKASGDKIERMRAGRNRANLADLARKAARWAADTAASLPADPALPEAMNDREGDISVVLMAIAAHAGPVWASRARAALLGVFGLRAENEENLEVGSLLLADLWTIFDGTTADRMTSADICAKLTAMDDRPWPEWRQGKPITAPQLANVLRPFGVRPTTIRVGDFTPKGYLREAFKDPWNRYVRTTKTPSLTSRGDFKPQHRNNTVKSNGYEQNGAATHETSFRPEISKVYSPEQQCCGVAAETPLSGVNGHVAGDEVVI